MASFAAHILPPRVNARRTIAAISTMSSASYFRLFTRNSLSRRKKPFPTFTAADMCITSRRTSDCKIQIYRHEETYIWIYYYRRR